MQSCSIVGNIVRINTIQNTNKVFLTIADHYTVKGQDGKSEQRTNFVPLEGFLPTGLNLQVGQLVAATFRVSSFKDGSGMTKTANDIIGLDVTLRSKGRPVDAAAAAADAPAAQAEAPAPTGEGMAPDAE